MENTKQEMKDNVLSKQFRDFEFYIVNSDGTIFDKLKTCFLEPLGINNVKLIELKKYLSNGKVLSKIFVLERVIFETFNKEIPVGYKIVFKDGDRSNFALENLELLSNSNDSFDDEFKTITNNKKVKKYNAYDLEGNLVHSFDNLNQAKELGYNISSISCCLHKTYGTQRNVYKNLKWFKCAV